MKDLRATGVTLRLILIVGFGLTLALWLVAGYQVTNRMEETRRQAGLLSDRYAEAQERLSAVRGEILAASVLVRDALLDPDPRTRAAYQEEIEGVYGLIDATLEAYVPVENLSTERDRVAQLRRSVEAFGLDTAEIFSTDPEQWEAASTELLGRFLPRRQVVMSVAEEVQGINRAAFLEQQRETRRIQASLQRQVWTLLGVALAMSFSVGVIAFGRATRLEQDLKAQREREERFTADLQRLSARLVTMREEEQRRISRELHDEVGQALSAVKLELTAAAQHLDRTGVGGDLLKDARTVADGALRSVRDLSQLLHPSALEDLGLSAALRSYAVSFGKRSGIVVDVTDEIGDTRIWPEAERACYRIVQEALTNVGRHARATKAGVSLRQTSNVLEVVITDNGVGFNVADERHGDSGLGLLGIRERVAQLGGTLHIESGAGRGTRLEVRVPLDIAERPAKLAVGEALPALAAREVRHG